MPLWRRAQIDDDIQPRRFPLELRVSWGIGAMGK